MDIKTLQTNFERELLFQIIRNLRMEKLTKMKAQKMAKAFLPTLSFQDADTFIQKNARLCEFYPEIMEAFLVTVKEYDDQLKVSSLTQARKQLEKSDGFSLKASGIIHARHEEQSVSDVNDSKTHNIRQESLTIGGE